ncbi:MAG: tRNA 2-selenouridine(34) synthase MnmH [Flavobacterium sp.]|nr:tRNA 2-selenouridine(34) synthase MnmH [Pedobacter sp.]
MIKPLDISDFINLEKNIPVIDVRTPLEFEHAHIPRAFNIPIFSNEERVQVGTTYKQKGREQAILLGFDFTGPKWSAFIRQALEIAPEKKIALHCWRGGMRSGAMAWALDMYGFEVYLLEGGYKKFRNWVLGKFTEHYQIFILGGMTGSGKTQVLKELKIKKQQVVDLEALADHQGSSYGSMGKTSQPSQEYFENLLAVELHSVNNNQTVWLEDESLTIGKRFIPTGIWQQMRIASVLKMIVPAEERIEFLAKEYGELNQQFLIESTQRIAKRLGPEQTRHAVEAINDNRIVDFVRQVLVYYDKTYALGLNKRDPKTIIPLYCDGTEPLTNATMVLNHFKMMQPSVV